MSNHRLVTPDLVRGIAVIAMIQAHAWEYYFASPASRLEPLHLYLVKPLGAYAPALFLMVSGYSTYLGQITRRGVLLQRSRLWGRSLVRGIWLLSIGLTVSWVTGHFIGSVRQYPVNWSIVELVGLCVLSSAITAAVGRWIRLLLLVTVFWASLGHWQSAISLFSGGFAPPFPWAVYFLVGFIGADARWLSIDNRSRGLVYSGAVMCVLLGISATGIALGQQWQQFHAERPNALTLSANSVLFLTFVWSLTAMIELRLSKNRIVQRIAVWGQLAFSLYYIQLVLVVGGGMLFARFVAYTPPWYWHPVLVAAYVFCMDRVLHYWSIWGYAMSLEKIGTSIRRIVWREQKTAESPAVELPG